MLAEPTAAQREVLGAMPYSAQHRAAAHRHPAAAASAARARASWNFRRPTGPRGHVTVTYDLTRLQRLATDTRYLVTLGGEDLVDPATVIDRMEYEHPLYTPASVAAQRRLPELDTDRVAFAGAYHGWGFHEDGARSGVGAAAAPRPGVARAGGGAPVPDVGGRGRVYRTTIRHTRRDAVPADLRAPLAAVARRRRRPARPRPARHVRGPRPPRRPAPLDPRQPRRVPRPRGGRGAAGPGPDGRATPGRWATASTRSASSGASTRSGARSPPSSRCTTPTATGTPTSSTPTTQGRRDHPQGDVRLAVPRHRRHLRRSPSRCRATACTSRSRCAPTTARSSAPRSPGPAPTRRRWRAAPAALRGTVLIHAHGICLWARRLPVRPRPRHHQEGVS